MTFEDFVASTQQSKAPEKVNPQLLALWYDARDDWESSHNIAQDIHSNMGSWIHAYLHRKEGDLSNARYWYHRAGKNEFTGSLEEEWKALVKANI
ncbi:hypothetical protein PZB74_19050 [Porifericola rhodea]|uniref:hypothetical protein n=1 Tax=Porifericola rhodea TaxID=930972 RepID=UPI00266553F5|nr:hypothetical protein [Porifericola rhodea]WKN31051.1 hypothetical protein PZB74_19050 [Porifericola rhodea]